MVTLIMNRALVISDNLELTSYLKHCAEESGVLNNCHIDYNYSFINKSPEKLIELGLSPINLKESHIIDELIKKYTVIISLHCKQIFPTRLVESVRCINIHPGFNPYNRGWFPQVFSIINGKPVGVTIHLMDTEIDHGNIIYQEKVPVFSYDTSETIYLRVLSTEKKLLKTHIHELLLGESSGFSPISEGNYNSISDFNKLCELDLNDQGTLRDHINLLRALTHGEIRNAYFINEQGLKVFVKIRLES